MPYLGDKWLREKLDNNLPESYVAEGELKVLECRWNPVKTFKDKILSLIVQTQKESSDLTSYYKEFLAKIIKTVPSLQSVTVEKMCLTWPPKHLLQELKKWQIKTLR